MILADSDTVIEILRRNPIALANLQSHLQKFGSLAVSAMTLYEVERGLHIRQAAVQRSHLNTLRPQIHVLPVAEQVAARAVHLYLHLRTSNQFLPDADILIAATALTHNLTLATSNQRHYSRIPGLALVDWRQTAST